MGSRSDAERQCADRRGQLTVRRGSVRDRQAWAALRMNGARPGFVGSLVSIVGWRVRIGRADGGAIGAGDSDGAALGCMAAICAGADADAGRGDGSDVVCCKGVPNGGAQDLTKHVSEREKRHTEGARARRYIVARSAVGRVTAMRQAGAIDRLQCVSERLRLLSGWRK